MLPTEVQNELWLYYEFRVHKWLRLYVPPFLLILGTFGNVFSFIILTRKSMRKVSSYIYLAVLSITDTLVLYVGLLRLWVGEITEYDVRDHSDWICKCTMVFGYTVSDYSVWLIIAMTVERYIAVCHALKAPSMCNRQRAIKVIISIGVIIFAINFHFFFTTQITMNAVEEGSEKVAQCNPREGLESLYTIWHWVDAFIYSFLPFVILIVLNGLIICKVLLAKQNRIILSAESKRGSQSPRHQNRSQADSARLTVMLLTISFAFLITTLPMNVNLILGFYWTSKGEDLSPNDQYKFYAKAQMVRTITELLMYTNHSINFFLYCATGQKFRQQLCQLLCYRRQHMKGHTSIALSDLNTNKTRLPELQSNGNNHDNHTNAHNVAGKVKLYASLNNK